MSIKTLPFEIQSLLNAAAKINSFKKAIEELVYNSLDAEATSVAIRVDIYKQFIQVVDNGVGIPKSDLPLLGERYASSKIADISVFRSAQNKYGFRGESLSNIIEVSKSVTITTRYEKTKETLVKCFFNGRYKDTYSTTMRPSKGTTIEVKGFLYNLHIQERATNALNELQNIKIFLQQLSLVITNISISFRDNCTNEILFKIQKNRDFYQTLSSLFEIDKSNVQEIQVEKNPYRVKAYIGKIDTDLDSYKWIYLNGRFIYKSTLHDIVNANFTKSTTICRKRKLKNSSNDLEMPLKGDQDFPHYFIFISCPYLDYDLSFTSKKTLIEFNDWSQIKQLLEKLAKFYNGDINIKELERKPPEKSKKVQNTREEVKKIMEKILGNQSKKLVMPQMRKDIKGKITRKRDLNRMGNNIITKTLHQKSNKILQHKHVENQTVSEKNPKVLNNSPIRNELTIIKNKRNLKTEMEKIKKVSKNSSNKLQEMNKKSLKYGKMKQKSNLKASDKHFDPLIKKFNEETYSVKHKCNLYSQNIKNVLYNKMKQRYENHKNQNGKDDNKAFEYEFANDFQNYGDSSIANENNNSIVPLNKVNKKYLKSYDLVKTILNTQKHNNLYDRKETMTLQNDTNEYSSSENNNNNCTKTIKHVNDTESSISTFEDISSIPGVTFQSHNYDKHSIVFLNKNRLTQFHHRSKRKITTTERYNSYLHFKSLTANSEKNKFKIPYSKSNNYIHYNNTNYTKLSSHIMEVPDTNNTIQNFKILNSESWSSMFRNSTHYDELNYEVTSNIHNTYTVIDSNVSQNFQNHFSIENVTNITLQEPLFSSKDIFNSLRNSNEQENNWHQFSKSDGVEKDMKIIFVSNSQNPESERNTVMTIEPLNVCETVFHNSDPDNDELISQHRDKIGSDKEAFEPNNLRTVNTMRDDLSYINKEIEEIAHHFNKLCNSKGSDLDFYKRGSVNHEECDNFNGIEEINFDKQNKSQNGGDGRKTLNAYIENKQDNVNYDKRHDSDINNFELQTRHSILPKGMSPIFENCQSKRICSYSLEVDYFQDDLYHNFANSVLVNTKIYENRIQHINENKYKNVDQAYLGSKNNNYLKFNANSLANAKVFSQVDKKFIMAELHSVTNKKLKYLVLFDQHAVHERIRLEKNMSDYKNGNRWYSTRCETLHLKLAKDSILYLNNFKDKFTQLGLDWTIQNDCEVVINAIPLAIFGKHCRQPDIILRSIKNLILEEVQAIKSFSGNTLLYPKSIMDLVFSEACRYAIKFGDKISKIECATLITSLSNCNTPFQCAHGRPVMAVLLDLKSIDNKYKVDMSKISMFANKLMK